MAYLSVFIASVIVSAILAYGVRYLSLKLKIQDWPKEPRKIHKSPIPLLGGLAMYLAFFGMSFALLYLGVLTVALARPLFWLFAAATIIMVGGFLDDKYSLLPKIQIIFPLAAVFLALYGGVRINLITNPFGGILPLGLAASLILSFIWLLTMTYTTKILDGLDGLVSGVGALCALTIFLFTTLTDFKEAGIPYVALALAGSFVGFLFLNRYPAKIFLGEGGSIFSGFILGALAIMTGAKIAITLMVLALPLVDLLVVVIKRAYRKKSIFSGDRLHLHYFLVDKGWKPQRVAYLYWAFAAILGLASIFLPSIIKIFFLFFVITTFFFLDLLWFKEK